MSLRALTCFALLVAPPALVRAQPAGHDHRADAPPTQLPPAPKPETWAPKRGQTWIPGSYEWKAGAWAWKPGHFESRKKGKRWTEPRWEQHGEHYEPVAGSWIDAPKDPYEPPAVIVEPPQYRHGQIWVRGYWEWSDGGFEWVPGHLVARPKGKRWTDGHWDSAGGKWSWTAGGWFDAPKTQQAPPPPPVEPDHAARAGYVWAHGNYEWRDGDYEWVDGHWEREHPNKHWVDGKWGPVDGKWTWIPGAWQ